MNSSILISLRKWWWVLGHAPCAMHLINTLKNNLIIEIWLWTTSEEETLLMFNVYCGACHITQHRVERNQICTIILLSSRDQETDLYSTFIDGILVLFFFFYYLSLQILFSRSRVYFTMNVYKICMINHKDPPVHYAAILHK